MDSPPQSVLRFIPQAAHDVLNAISRGELAPILLCVLLVIAVVLWLLFEFISSGTKTAYKTSEQIPISKGQKCPQCNLISPPRAEQCSCGHQFSKAEKILGNGFIMIGKPYNGPYERWVKFGNPEKGKKQFKP
jgi:hypothetical protein